VSTAIHEFFGVSVIEGILGGCFPLCPNSLVYPEYLGKDNLYNSKEELVGKMKNALLHKLEFKGKDDIRKMVDWNGKLKQDYFILLDINE